MKPQIISADYGEHNRSLERSANRLIKRGGYKDQSTICITPTIDTVPTKVLASWFSMMTPMNQKFIRMWPTGMEVGQAYSETIEVILQHGDLTKWKYILTVEADNIPPPDGLIMLLESIKDYDAVGGLYWTKGAGGQPMIYGDPAVMPRNFMPQVPRIDSVQPCNGLGMGFTLFRTEMFKDRKLPRPLFKTLSEYLPQQGARVMTQDLYFFENALNCGYRFACDTRVKVGHYDLASDMVW